MSHSLQDRFLFIAKLGCIGPKLFVFIRKGTSADEVFQLSSYLNANYFQPFEVIEEFEPEPKGMQKVTYLSIRS